MDKNVPRRGHRPARPRDEPKASSGANTQRDVDGKNITGQQHDRTGASGLDQERSGDDLGTDVDRSGVQRSVRVVDRVNLLLANTDADRAIAEITGGEYRNSHRPWRSRQGSASPTRQRSRSMPAALRVRERLRKITEGEPIDADAARARIARLRGRTDSHLRAVSDCIKTIGKVTERMRESVNQHQQDYVEGSGVLRAGFGAFAEGFVDLLERLIERARSPNAYQSSSLGQLGDFEKQVERAEPICEPIRPSLKP